MKKFHAPTITSVLFLTILFTVSLGTMFKALRPYLEEIRRNGISVLIDADSQGTAVSLGSDTTAPAHPEANDRPLIDFAKGQIQDVQDWIHTVDARFSDSVLLRESFVNLNGGFSRLLNKKIMDDADTGSTIYRLKNGALSFHYGFQDQSENIEKMTMLRDLLQSQGTELLFVQAPFKINKYEEALPYKIQDETNLLADAFLKGLSEAKIDFLDIREKIHEQRLANDTLFYQTDHHWKISTAFWAHVETMKHLRQNYGYFFTDLHTESDSFETIKSESPWLGSQGRRVGSLYGGTDDFSAMVPRFDTSYTLTAYNNENGIIKTTEGDFSEAVMVKDLLTNPNMRVNRYAAYLGRDYPNVELSNHNVNNGKLLVLQDSFGLPFSSFMSLHFYETHILDLRHYNKTSLVDHLVEESYDFVIFLYNPSILRSRAMFQFE